MIRNFILRHERLVYRFLEILPGFVSWNLILFPYWGILLIPNVVAYFILAYNIYWLYQSFQIAISATISHFRVQSAMIYDWLGDLKSFPDWRRVNHLIIITTYKEPVYTLERTLTSLAHQTLPKDQIHVVLAMEKKEPEEDRNAKLKILKRKFGRTFGNFFVTTHQLMPGEIAGKSSNERYAALWAKDELTKLGMDLDYLVVTSCDADHKFHHNHFAYLTYSFLDNPKRYTTFWQAGIMYYNNIWRLPAITRVPNTLGSIWNLSLLPRKDKLINTANYSLSFRLLDEVGYWDPDKIPEDWGIFFKAYYAKNGNVEVEPLYLPLYADAAEGPTLLRTLVNEYNQKKRWAWGVSDDPWIIRNYFLNNKISFWDKTTRVLFLIQAHFLWPVHFFIITIGLSLPSVFNPRFARTTLGYTIPKLSSTILTIALVFLLIILVLDKIYKPTRPKDFPVWRALLTPLEFVLMPIAGFFLLTLPGIDAHTRLMLGKYIQYKVTEKI
jgi:cellulose synthase/poly-beta-1,6-N-acetylglucosamine synthase-like glycosyltransferase